MSAPCPHPDELVRTPELERPNRDETVYWCATCRRHLTVRPSFLDGVRRTIRFLQRFG